MRNQKLLKVENLRVHYFSRYGIVQAVQNIDFEIGKGEIVGLVGESGSGKSTVGLALMGLLPESTDKAVSGRILLNGRNILKFTHREMQSIRGCEISMTFQDPMTFLNPVMRIGDQIVETVRRHQKISNKQARDVVLNWLMNVNMNEPERVVNAYPHQISGGMRQRVLIAQALSCEPNLLIADEPTTALDVTIQRGILELLASIRDRFNTSVFVITHDLGVVSELCDRVYVMYAGKILEQGDVDKILLNPKNPYTQALLKSALSIDEYHPVLYSIGGTPPSLVDPDQGCNFRDRCPHSFSRCIEEPPSFVTEGNGWSKCWLNDPEVVPIC